MTKSVEFYFDVGSPAAYLAWTQLPRICADAGADLIYRPMLLGAVFQAVGNASPAAVPAKGRYVGNDYARFARRYGVPFALNPHFPIMTLSLMRAIVGIQQQQPERLLALLQSLFTAIWVDALNLNELGVIAKVLAESGFDPEQLLALANQPEVKEALKANTAQAIASGVFGAPTMFVGAEMFFGQDRLDFVREALAENSG